MCSFSRSIRAIAWRFISSSSVSHCEKPDLSVDGSILADIKLKIEQNKLILRKHSYSHSKARKMDSSIANLHSSLNSVRQKQGIFAEPPPNSLASIPAHVSIEVLGNGTCHMRPCVAIRTPLKTYLFNCPEGTTRFLPQLRLKPHSVNDIFITRSTWDNIAGISSILLSKDSSSIPTRLHGSVNVKHFLECIRPFQDADYGSAKYPSQVDERPYTMENYEDAAIKVTYIPSSPPFSERDSESEINVAYLVELKPTARRIDPKKLISMQIPKGPLIGRLKNGESVKLIDGRVVHPGDVLSDASPKDERPTALFVECSGVAQVKALLDNSIIKMFLNNNRSVNYIIHMSEPSVISLPEYGELVKGLGLGSFHIVVNSSCPVIPGVESIYRNHRLLNSVSPVLFPQLYPIGWSGLVTQNSELSEKVGVYLKAAPLQRFWMREGGSDEPIIADLRDVDLALIEEVKDEIEEMNSVLASLPLNCEFPRISFLGTSSAVPSKYRNVSAYLLEANPSSAVLVDVGEGSYGQMHVLLGKERCTKMMINLKAIFVTHAHQDHMNGLYTIIEKRKEAFEVHGQPYVPLVLVCNRNVLKPLKTYSMCFSNLESLIAIVDISRHPETPPMSPGGPPNKRRRLPSPILSATRDIITLMPRPLFNEVTWNIHEIKAVQVHHTRMANGFVFNVGGKRVVFSGDTKPCELLVKEGKGADLLIHEATFEDGHEVDAIRKKHSTMQQAVEIGQKMGAANIILTHFSARYPKVPDLPRYLEEYGNVGVAVDNLCVRYDHLPLVPKLIPIFRKIYKEELFEIELRKEQRILKNKEEKEIKGLMAK